MNTAYKTMVTVRILEEELQKLCLEGEAGDLHFYKGQEAIAVGACEALWADDYIVVHHRTIAHAIAKGVPMYSLVCEILGKAPGLNHGFAGEMHLHAPDVRFMFSFQLVGTCVPVAAGLAWAVRNYRQEDNIVAVFHGDAATSNAQWHEGLNIAAVQQVPLLLICENNGLAGNVRKEYYLPTEKVSQRAAAYGIEAVEVYGNDVELVRKAVEEAAQYVRETGRPFLVECQTTRLSWHKQGQRDVRSQKELYDLAILDPLLNAQKRFEISDEARDALLEETRTHVCRIIEEAQKAPLP